MQLNKIKPKNINCLVEKVFFLGMISSAFVWGFLIDTLGRKKLLVVGYLLDGIFVVASSFSQNFIFLIVFKFLGGFM